MFVLSTYRNEHLFADIQELPNCQTDVISAYFVKKNLQMAIYQLILLR